MTSLQTERLELRPFTLDDASAYWPLVSDPEVLRFTGESPLQSLAEVRGLLAARPLRDYAIHGYGRLACIEKSTGELVGFCGLKYLEDLCETDIGYRFLPRYWGLGYATESATAVMRHGTDILGLKRIIGLVEPGNAGSIRVLEKLGLGLESRITLADHPAELLSYSPPGSGRTVGPGRPCLSTLLDQGG
ncbi:GNAT family N-acetyltransferase [Marilutibacter aestuarii]|uniref:GNAT family N-acetyltransferase n=1 Tax=Marilutibacter aestuarii TaxID=1706195 RepID=A0A508A0C0_9GAMM|nr:GNAT family N-acetyltransferase [Lysobacter aestuarii]TQD42271.1 GNAT family N-acetyltransferase [Lysobacter aestuarii]